MIYQFISLSLQQAEEREREREREASAYDDFGNPDTNVRTNERLPFTTVISNNTHNA